jgi:UDP-N-acetylglucosamine 2-epimerase (non-hydrolysing)
MKIISVVGARPNFMKIAPLIAQIKKFNQKNSEDPIQHILVHTGQHYDIHLSKRFFKELNIPEPDINLDIGSGTHAEQVGNTMIAFEKVLQDHHPDWVIVVGDVNATLACSVTAKKENIKCCHIEAGLRSGDLTMPEEINRLVTDRLSDLLLTPDQISSENLLKEGIAKEKIHFVGNIMIDTLEANIDIASKSEILDILTKNNLLPERNLEFEKTNFKPYALLTMHRPSNVDYQEILEPILDFLIEEVVTEMPLIWPIHPRTMKQIKKFSLWNKVKSALNMILLHPIGYLDMLRLNMDSRIMLTDSGGLQEECSVLGTPCLTLRWNTERPITLRENGGVSVLVGNSVDKIRTEFKNTIQDCAIPNRPKLWDGNTAVRCLNAVLNYQKHKIRNKLFH